MNAQNDHDTLVGKTPSLLKATGLRKVFRSRVGARGRGIVAVDDVDLTIGYRQTVGLVGESGSGKSTLGRLMLRLIEPDAGSITLAGEDVLAAPPRPLRHMRRQMQFVLQDPLGSLDPRMTVGQSIAEPLKIHNVARGSALRGRVVTLLVLVGLSEHLAGRYPHELSGGQRQRVGLARALALEPKLIVCDEPVSALDVSVQSQILNLLVDLQKQFGLSYLLIAHDLAVVRHVCETVAVMHRGRIVEQAPTGRLFAMPAHPYTQELLASIPRIGHRSNLGDHVDSGRSGEASVQGCGFAPRCPCVMARCRRLCPQLKPLTPGAPDHLVACHARDTKRRTRR